MSGERPSHETAPNIIAENGDFGNFWSGINQIKTITMFILNVKMFLNCHMALVDKVINIRFFEVSLK